MHETVIAKKIIEEANKLQTKHSLELEVGELSELTPEEIKEPLETMTSWNIKINFKEGKIKCTCGFEGKPKILEKGHGFTIFECPSCQNKKSQVLEGGEIKITGYE